MMKRIAFSLVIGAGFLGLVVGCAGGGGSTDPITVVRTADGIVSFAGTVNPILQDHCLRCHSAQKNKGNFSIASYDTIMKGGNRGVLVVAGDPDNSQIVGSVTKTKVPYMPPKVFPALTEDRIQALKEWIAQGALNN